MYPRLKYGRNGMMKGKHIDSFSLWENNICMEKDALKQEKTIKSTVRNLKKVPRDREELKPQIVV
jgi:hypothetical protein